MLIVAVHVSVVAFFRLGTDPTMERYLGAWTAFETLAHNSTILFALISGLLYSTVLAGRPWLRFFHGKALYVLVPYLVFTALYTLVILPFWGGVELFGDGAAAFVSKFAGHALHGTAAFHLWYIPVLLALFLTTPAIAFVVRQSRGGWIIALLVSVPLFLARSWPENSPLNVLVFLAPYAFGIWLGAEYRTRLALLHRMIWPLALLFGLASVATAYLFYIHYGPVRAMGQLPDWPVNLYETASYVQKMALSCLLLLWLARHEDWLPRWLDGLARYAFAIYFVHLAVIMVLMDLLGAAGVAVGSQFVLSGVAIIIWLVTLALSLAISVAAKRLLGRWSRPVIGA